MRTRHTLPADTYRVRFSAYCGMGYDIETGLTLADAHRTMARLLRRRRRTGHPVTVLKVGREYECGEPDGCAMVPDTAGIASIDRETVPAWECFECGDILPEGVPCECQSALFENYTGDDETEDE